MLDRGVYETLVTEALNQLLGADRSNRHRKIDELRNAEAADRLAYHLASVVERSITAFPESQRASEGAKLIRQLVDIIASAPGREPLKLERPAEPPHVLRAISNLLPDGSSEDVQGPLIPLLDTTLLTNSPGEPRVGHQIHAEIASADGIDVVMAFVRRSGISPLRDSLRKHVQSGKRLRILTTTYTGSTEAEALEWLLNDIGAEVRISYDTTGTRLHAKSWLFHRNSGFSTAYVGSSNLTHSAQASGLEWNVRISGVRNRSVIEKMSAVFESYWEQADFEQYDAERFKHATRSARTDEVLALSPIEIRLEPFQERLLEEIEIARQEGYHRNHLCPRRAPARPSWPP